MRSFKTQDSPKANMNILLTETWIKFKAMEEPVQTVEDRWTIHNRIQIQQQINL